MSFLRKRIEKYNRKARRPAEPKKTLKEKTHLDSSTGSSEENEKEQEYDSDLSSEYDGGPAHGFYNQISNMKLKKELTANKIRLLREAKRYDRMMNHLMREVQRLNALVRSLMQRNSNMDRPTKKQKAAKNEKKEQKKPQLVRTNKGMQTEKIRKVDMAAQVTEEESTSPPEEKNSVLLRTIEKEERDASQNHMSSSEENNSIINRIMENERNDAYQILMLNPAEEQIANDQEEEPRRITTSESKITQTDPVQQEKLRVIEFLVALSRYVMTNLRWPELPQLPYDSIYVFVVIVMVMLTALYFC